jgi:hypothetical protein
MDELVVAGLLEGQVATLNKNKGWVVGFQAEVTQWQEALDRKIVK